MSVPPAGRILTLHESDAVPDTVRDHRALWRLQSAVPEAEADGVPSPHYLDRSLEALRKKAKGVQPPALAQQPMLTVQPHEADLVQVPVPGAPRTALTVAQAVTTAIQLLADPDMTTEALRARAGALLVEGSLRGTGHRPVRPSVRDFFTLAEVQRGHWHCLRCSVINRRDEPSCHKCGDTFESIVGVAPDAELNALTRVTQGTAYGRSLHSLAGREQDVRAGAPVEIGAAGYQAAVREQLRSFQFEMNAQRIEPAVSSYLIFPNEFTYPPPVHYLGVRASVARCHQLLRPRLY